MGTKGKRRLGILAGVLVLLYLVLWKVILPAGLERAIPLVEQTAGGYINGQLQMETMEVSPDLTFTARNLRLEDEQGNLVAQVPALSLGGSPEIPHRQRCSGHRDPDHPGRAPAVSGPK